MLRKRHQASEGDDDNTKVDKVLKKLRSLDAYSKVHDDYAIQTNSGGLISIISFTLMFVLFCSQLSEYLTIEVDDHITVDTMAMSRLPIGMNITFPHLRCDEISVDTVDSTGDNQVDVSGGLQKRNLDINGKIAKEWIPDKNECYSCLEADDAMKKKKKEKHKSMVTQDNEPEEKICCNSCSDLKKAYSFANIPYYHILDTAVQCTSNIGCSVAGDVLVSKVGGNVHVALGKSKIREGRHVHEFNINDVGDGFNTSHIIHRLDFGAPIPGIVPPLEGITKIIKKGAFMFHYYIKLIPTSIEDTSDPTKRIFTHQYSVTETSRNVLTNTKDLAGLPGVFFVYEFNPFMVEKRKKQFPLTHFLTSLCAILGGIFSVAGMVDHVLYHRFKRRD